MTSTRRGSRQPRRKAVVERAVRPTPSSTHQPRSWSKDEAPLNMLTMLVTPLIAQPLMSWSKAEAAEHYGHIRDAVNRPITDVLVKGRGLKEDAEQILDIANAPGADRLVKRLGVVEHPLHISNGPNAPIADRSIKVLGAPEHLGHGRDAGGVPRADVFVEGRNAS